MNSETIISVFVERMRLQRYAAGTIKSYKEHVVLFLQAMQQHDKLSDIPIADIETFLNSKVVENKISPSYQRGLVGAIKKLYLLLLEHSLKLDYLLPKRSERKLPQFFFKDEVRRIFDHI